MNQKRRMALAGMGISAMAALSTRRLQASIGPCSSILDQRLRPLMKPEPVSLCERYSGQVLLFVNTASRCGFTPQFEQLESLHQRYSTRGFSVLGFPSDDFRQELDDEAEVAEFCQLNYGVSFPMFQKLRVSGPQAHPLYQALAAGGGDFPRWNFFKYLVGRDGQVLARYASNILPTGDVLVSALELALAQNRPSDTAG